MGKIIGSETPNAEQKVELKNCSYNKTPEFIFEIISN